MAQIYRQVLDPDKNQKLMQLLIIALGVIFFLGGLCFVCYGCMLLAEWYLDNGGEVDCDCSCVQDVAMKVL